MRYFLVLILIVFATNTITAQNNNSVQFYFDVKKLSDSSATLVVKAVLKDGLNLFSIKKSSADNPFVSTLTLDSSKSKHTLLQNNVVETGKLQLVKDSLNNYDYRLFADSVTFNFPLLLNRADTNKISGEFIWLGKKGDEFPNGTEAFSLKLSPNSSSQTQSPAGPLLQDTKPVGWTLFLICVLTGFLAVFTPCVFPLIPVTVSFFLKKSKTKAEGVKKAWWYAASIILIYTIPTLILTLVFGDKFIYQVSTHPISNLLFFAIFVVFAISFFGAFEIGLPSSWANKTDEVSQRGGMAGIFFMALTLVIVSFSCTGPIVAGLLSETSGKGVSMGPAIGMLGFGIGLAIPFGIFALFPSMLQSLPRSGGWLNTVKVFFGFIELALAMKFLSNADLVYHWGLLSRDVFLSIWIVIFIMLGLYLLGKLKFSHDSDLEYITVTRLFIAIASISFAVYMIPGLWGAPLKPLSGILPPPSTQDFNLDELKYLQAASPTNSSQQLQEQKDVKPVKYIDKFHVPFGLTAYFDLEEGLVAARKLNKPVMLDFTGWSCANCRKMENEVWSHPEVLKRIKNDFVLVSLYVDDRTELPESEQTVTASGEKIRTIGDKNLEYEKTAFNLNAQPLYKFLNKDGEPLSEIQYGYDGDVNRFIQHLDMVKKKFDSQP
ncbi:MAG: cytochrome c biogenesis protein CcdA [Bacteroidota bacterium]